MSLSQGQEEVVGWKLSRKQEQSGHGKVTTDWHSLLRQGTTSRRKRNSSEILQRGGRNE